MRAALVALLLACAGAQAAEPLRVGSKRFTESYILGEIIVKAAGDAVHRQGLGNTGIVFAALKAGSIDLYPEYTGTIAKEILKLDGNPGIGELNRALAPLGFGVAVPLGFNNTYALAMREERAQKLGVRTLSDLAKQPSLKLGLSQEFIGRADGWPGLKAAYKLPFATPSGLDHGLAYEAVAAGKIDVMDIYSTDAKIERYSLRVLEDDRKFFPRYDAVLLYRLDVPKRFPDAWRALEKLEGRIDEANMIRMNAAAELQGRSFAEAAALLNAGDGPQRVVKRNFFGVLFGPDFWRLTREHLLLVFASLAASIALGVPLGVAAAKLPRMAQPILGVVGVIQTIPSLALFAFLIALVGTIGTFPALIALFLYALLPIVRSTHAGFGRHRHRHAPGGDGARTPAARSPVAGRSAARAAFDPRRHQDLRGDQRRYRHHCCVHRCRRLRRAHRSGAPLGASGFPWVFWGGPWGAGRARFGAGGLGGGGGWVLGVLG